MKFAGNMELVPRELRAIIPLNAGEEFRRKHYFEELANIIGERQQGKKVKVPVHVRADASEIAERETVLKLLGEVELQKVEEMVVAQYEESLGNLPEESRSLLPVHPPKVYWETRYYETMFAMFPAGDGAAGAGKGVVPSAAQGPFASGAKPGAVGMEALLGGAVYTTEMSLGEVELEWVGSAGMREEEIAGTRNKFEGWLIECDDSARNVEFKQGVGASPKRPADSSAGSTCGTSAVDCLLADNQGPVVGVMWEDAGVDLLRIRNSRSLTDPKPLVIFEGVRIVKVKETVYSGKKFNAIEGHALGACGRSADRNQDLRRGCAYVAVHDGWHISFSERSSVRYEF
jgi:hypothetical protein